MSDPLVLNIDAADGDWIKGPSGWDIYARESMDGVIIHRVKTISGGSSEFDVAPVPLAIPASANTSRNCEPRLLEPNPWDATFRVGVALE